MYTIVEFMSSSPSVIMASYRDNDGMAIERQGVHTLLFRTEEAALSYASEFCQIGKVIKVPSNALGYVDGVYFEDIMDAFDNASVLKNFIVEGK